MKSKVPVKTIFANIIPGAGAVMALLGLGAVQAAHAQVGVGWTQIHPQLIWNGDLPQSERYSKSGNVEHFWVYNTDPHGPTGSGSRSEFHVNNTFSTGSEQAQGDFMAENNTDAYTVFQDFGNPVNATSMQLQVRSHNGTLRVYNNQAVATGCWGVYTRINVVHYLDTGTIEVWANGSKATSFSDGGPHDRWFKYGDYDTASASTYTGCYWRGMSFYQGGSAGSSSGIDTSAKYQLQNEASGLVLNNQGSTADNSKITQYSSVSSDNLRWKFIATSGGYYQINSVKSGLDAVVQGASTAQGAGIIQYSFGSAQNDQWLPQKNSDGSYTFVNRHSGLVL
ncbi:MAG TPA: RICIN domain-containing protein, partial [Verrucomicrobiae bacterium]|nr:RICIN domain-containing protein [Verrucomicrobiae bacterium]